MTKARVRMHAGVRGKHAHPFLVCLRTLPAVEYMPLLSSFAHSLRFRFGHQSGRAHFSDGNRRLYLPTGLAMAEVDYK
jgi:hypothetical protein